MESFVDSNEWATNNQLKNNIETISHVTVYLFINKQSTKKIYDLEIKRS